MDNDTNDVVRGEFAEWFCRIVHTRGMAEGKAEAILSVLRARGLDAPEELAARIRACTPPVSSR